LKPRYIFFLLIALLIISIIMGISIGSISISLAEQAQIFWGCLFSPEQINYDVTNAFILLHIRLPRVLLAALVGFTLALCGVIMQGLFQNPLADPYVLGVSSGATAGAALMISIGLLSTPFALPLGAFWGGILAIVLVYKIAHSQASKISTSDLILTGIAISTLFSALTAILISLSPNEQLRSIIFWIMGSLTIAKWSLLLPLLILVSFGTMIALMFVHHLNAFALGEEMAIHLGINPESLKKVLLILVTLLTSGVVCICGTIGFVGLIIPHIMRLLLGSDNRLLLPASALGGASFLILCDILARILAKPAELPIGVITAFFGALLFLYLLHIKSSS